MQFTVETEQEIDGRWIAEVAEIPGAMKYGSTRDEAIAHAEALALRVLAERLDNGEMIAEPIQINFAAA
jgi:predicted RNase H-like HicB family nuclease